MTDNKFSYDCHECGTIFKAKWVSKYSAMPNCPCCGENDMVHYANNETSAISSIKRKPRRTQVERWTNLIAEAEAQKSTIKPEYLTAFEKHIADLEKKLAHAIKNNI